MFATLLSGIRSILAHSAGLYARALCAIVAALAAFFALSYAATFIDRASLVAKLESANTRDAFRATYLTLGTRAYPRFAANDCLILPALLQDYPSRLAEAISIRLAPTEAVAAKKQDGEPTIPSCLQMIAALDRADHTHPEAQFYHRYLHGQRLFAILALAVSSPEMLGRITLTLNVLVLLCVLVPASRASRGDDKWRHRGYAVMAATLLLLNGLWLYGISFSHAISDLVLAAFLAYAYHSAFARAAEPKFAIAVGLFGAAVAIFEFLTGGIPLGLAILLTVIALDGPPDPVALLRRSGHGVVIFALAIVLALASKIVLVALFVDPDVFRNFVQGLATRVGSSYVAELPAREIAWLASHGIDVHAIERSWALSMLYMLARLGFASFVIGYGSTILGLAVLGTGVLATGILFIRLTRRTSDATARTRLVILFATTLIMPAWCVLFLNHTLLHAIFMVRPFCWYVAIAGILLLWTAHAGLAGAASSSRPAIGRSR